jgi:hypothetical protein
MISHRLAREATSVAILLFLANAPAVALDLNVGGISLGITSGDAHGALSASARIGDETSAAISVAPAGTVATISANTPAASANIGVSTDQVSVSASVPAANLNLGAALRANGAGENRDDGISGFGIRSMRGPGSLTGSQIAVAMSAAYTGLAASDQQLLRDRCGLILASPAAFEPSLVALCRFVGSLQVN